MFWVEDFVQGVADGGAYTTSLSVPDDFSENENIELLSIKVQDNDAGLTFRWLNNDDMAIDVPAAAMRGYTHFAFVIPDGFPGMGQNKVLLYVDGILQEDELHDSNDFAFDAF
jgi:hypothetical protein